MAISDTLFEAADEIRMYLGRPDGIYRDLAPDMRARIEKLLAEMDAIRIVFDTPPDLSEDELQRARLANTPAKGTA